MVELNIWAPGSLSCFCAKLISRKRSPSFVHVSKELVKPKLVFTTIFKLYRLTTWAGLAVISTFKPTIWLKLGAAILVVVVPTNPSSLIQLTAVGLPCSVIYVVCVICCQAAGDSCILVEEPAVIQGIGVAGLHVGHPKRHPLRNIAVSIPA